MAVVEPLATHRDAFARVINATPDCFSLVIFAHDLERSVLYLCKNYTTSAIERQPTQYLEYATVDLMNLEKVVGNIDAHVRQLAARKETEAAIRLETSEYTLVKLVDLDNSTNGDPDSHFAITHYVAPGKTVSERDEYYVGHANHRMVYTGTLFDVQLLGESPHNVRMQSQQAFIDAHKSMCMAPETVNFYALPETVQRLFNINTDWRVKNLAQ